MLGILVSREDRASEHVGEHLLALADWREERDDSRPASDGGGVVHRLDGDDGDGGDSGDGSDDDTVGGVELRTFDDLHIYLEGVDEAFSDDVDLVAFASRHSGETGPLLTAHPTGNFGPADYGGEADALARAAPNAAARALASLDAYAPDGYDTGLECTHHGPTDLDTPSLFVEVGSGPDQWDDPDAARAVARAILDLRGVAPDRERALAGFGGNHYVPRFERVVRETPWAVGHVAADWALDAMGHPEEHRAVLREAFERSSARHALVDGDHPVLERVLGDLGYRVVSETWVRETGDVPLALAEALEERVAPVAEGLRFGALAESVDASAVDALPVLVLPAALVEEVNGVDRDGAVAAVREHAVAFTTAESGTVLDGRVVLPGETASMDDAGREAYDALVDALGSVLEAKYDEVTRERDADGADGAGGAEGDGDEWGVLVARREAFSPERARELGVPEGPAFGRLADGQSVEVDGRTVPPERVRETETRRFPLEPGSDPDR